VREIIKIDYSLYNLFLYTKNLYCLLKNMETTANMKINPLLDYKDIQYLFRNDYNKYDFSLITETEKYQRFTREYMQDLFDEVNDQYLSNTVKHIAVLMNIEKQQSNGNITRDILRSYLQLKIKEEGTPNSQNK